MAIRRTRQDKVNTQVRREETLIHYQVPSSRQERSDAPPTKKESPAISQENSRFFVQDMKKSLGATIIVMLLLAFAVWFL